MPCFLYRFNQSSVELSVCSNPRLCKIGLATPDPRIRERQHLVEKKRMMLEELMLQLRLHALSVLH